MKSECGHSVEKMSSFLLLLDVLFYTKLNQPLPLSIEKNELDDTANLCFFVCEKDHPKQNKKSRINGATNFVFPNERLQWFILDQSNQSRHWNILNETNGNERKKQ